MILIRIIMHETWNKKNNIKNYILFRNKKIKIFKFKINWTVI